MAEFIEVLSEETKKQLDEFLSKLNQGVKAVNQMNQEFKNIKVPSEANKAIKKTATETKKLSDLERESIRLKTAIQRQNAKLEKSTSLQNKALQRLRFETAENNKLAKQRGIISSNLATAYQKEQARISILSNRYKDLATRQQMGIKLSKQEEKELKDVTNQINRKQQALKRVDANMGVFNRNVGNYKSAWSGLVNIFRASLGAFGAFTAIDIAKDIFNTIKEIDSLNKSLLKVTETQESFNQAKAFLSVLAEKTGTQITNLTRAYNKFFASAKTTNLTLQQTQNIFDAVTTASAALGLSTDDTEGALRALEQMLSKGNVQAEEIRGQLGERLPGAFQILAKSMGLTTQQLNKQLELGQVIAEEVLPKFAEELRKAYDVDRVETLIAAQGRLSNSWLQFIESVENGEGIISSTLKGIFEGLSGLLNGFTLLNTSFEELVGEKNQKNMSTIVKLFSDFDRTSKKDVENLNSAILELENNIKTAKNESLAYTYAMGGLGYAIRKDAKANIQSLNDSLLVLKQLKAGGDIDELTSAFVNMGKKGIPEVVKITEKFFEDRLKELRELQRTTAETSEPWQGYKKQIENTEKAFLKFMRNVKGLEDVESVNFLDERELQVVATNIDLVQQGIKETGDVTAEVSEKIKGDFKGAFDEIARMYQLDASRWNALFDDKKNTVKDYAIAFADLLGAAMFQITDMQIASIDRQIEANQRYYENQIELAEGNAQQQELLREQQARKENELRRKRAQAEKKQAIFESIISTAVAVAKALPNIALSIIVGALGAAKTALIASTPIPQYKKGRKGGPDEYAILGDGGKAEPILSKDGKLKGISPNKPTLMHLDRGDKVLSSMEMLTNDSLMNASIMASLASNSQKANEIDTAQIFEQILAKQQKETLKALRKAKFVNYNQNNIDLGRIMKKQKYR